MFGRGSHWLQCIVWRNKEFNPNPCATYIDFIPDSSTEPMMELAKYLELLKEQSSEKNYIENDTIRKFQIDYDESICMVERFPEAMHIERDNQESAKENVELNAEENQLHIVAPGEGKIPINLVYCKDWDAKAFPMLHPDGQNNLSDERRNIKLSDLNYFKQRLFNINPRWRQNTHWVFSAAVHREKKDFQRNIDLAYKKGQKQTNQIGETEYTLKDPYSVFQNVANTPAYHKKGKMEMMARLDNFGPFHVFFTLSCADYRWPENLTSILREHGIGLICSIESDKAYTYIPLIRYGLQWRTI